MLTSISMDHESWLGSRLYEIAAEKAGIVKPGRPVVCSCTDHAALELLASRCNDCCAPLYVHGRDFLVEVLKPASNQEPLVVKYQGMGIHLDDVKVGLRGSHQAVNAALVLAALELIWDQVDGLDEAAVRGGMAGVEWPGRLEITAGRPRVLLDGAHNPAAAKAPTETLLSMELPGMRVLVLGVSADKDLETMLEYLAPLFDNVVATSFPGGRARPAAEVAAVAENVFQRVETVEEPSEALERARLSAGPDGLVVVAGSLFLVGAVRAILRGVGEGDPFVLS